MTTIENLSRDSYEWLFSCGCMFETLRHIASELESGNRDELKIRNITRSMDVLKKALAEKGIEEGF